MKTDLLYIPNCSTSITTIEELYDFFDKKLKEIHYISERRHTCMLYPFGIYCYISENLTQQFFITHSIYDKHYTLKINKIEVNGVYRVSIHTFYDKYASDMKWTEEFV